MKNDLFGNLPWSVPPLLFSTRWLLQSHKKNGYKEWVVCMGKDALKLVNVDVSILNMQKGRVDCLINIVENPQLRTRTKKVVPGRKFLISL